MDVDDVLRELRGRFLRIQDYQVDLEVSLDMPRLRMPRKRMTFSFKQPDLTRLDAKGFAMVPRRGLALSPDSLLTEMDRLSVGADTLVDNHHCLLLTGSISGPEDIPVTAKILIDSDLWLIRQFISYLDSLQVFHLEIEYSEVAHDIYMPLETRFQFQMDEQFLRSRGRPRPYDPDLPQYNSQTAENLHGEAVIKFSRYRVNQGIPDSFFGDSNTD